MRASWRFVSALHAMTQGTARFTREAGGFSSRTDIFQWLLWYCLAHAHAGRRPCQHDECAKVALSSFSATELT